MAPMSQRKRKHEDGTNERVRKPKKKIRIKQKEYHSSSEDEDGFAPVNMNDSDNEGNGDLVATKGNAEPIGKRKKKATVEAPPVRETENNVTIEAPPVESDVSGEESEATGAESENDEEDDDLDSDDDGTTTKRKTKRNDPEAFSTSMSKILSTKLSQAVRKDPVLARSREAAQESGKVANQRLESRAKSKLRAQKQEDLQRGRIKDVLGLSTGQTGEIAEEEKRLRKVAQRGVVKLFNAVRAAQVRGEQAAREERKKGTVGMANREEKVNEMSKQGFLELISGKKTAAESAA